MLPTMYVLEIRNTSNQPEHHIENDKRRKNNTISEPPEWMTSNEFNTNTKGSNR